MDSFHMLAFWAWSVMPLFLFLLKILTLLITVPAPRCFADFLYFKDAFFIFVKGPVVSTADPALFILLIFILSDTWSLCSLV